MANIGKSIDAMDVSAMNISSTPMWGHDGIIPDIDMADTNEFALRPSAAALTKHKHKPRIMELELRDGLPVLTIDNLSFDNRSIAEMISKGYSFDICDTTIYSNVRTNKKASVSDTAVFFSNLSTKDSALKIFLDPPKSNNSLMVEVLIYRFIVAPLLAGNHTPCIVGFIGFSRCANFLENLRLTVDQTNELSRQFRNLLSVSAQRNPSFDYAQQRTINVLALAKHQNIQTMADWLATKPPEDHVIIILFQILYTICNFLKFKLRHNDLHLGNIFIQRDLAESNKVLKYVLPSNVFYMPGEIMPLIYDFDRGGVEDARFPRNSILDNYHCKHHGECNHYNPKFDAYKLLCGVAKITGKSYPRVHSFIVSSISQDLIDMQNIANIGCNLVNITGGGRNALNKKKYNQLIDQVVQGDFVPPDSLYEDLWMLPVYAMLQNSIFEPFSINNYPSRIQETYKLISAAQVNTLLNKVQ